MKGQKEEKNMNSQNEMPELHEELEKTVKRLSVLKHLQDSSFSLKSTAWQQLRS